MMLKIRALLCLSAMLAVAGAQAAEVGSGTLSLDQRMLEFSGGPIVGTNATNAAGSDFQCIDPLIPCDTFALTVDLPEDVTDFFPSALVRVAVDSTDSPTGSDDYDLNLYDSEGNLLGSSTSPGAAEAVSVLASGGVKDFTVEVVHWLVVGGSYGAEMVLDLGLPSTDKTEEEVEQWLADNSEGGSDGSSRSLAACSAPGVNILVDAEGDNTLTGVPGQDLLELNVFQTTDDDGSPLIGFQIVVDDLSQLTPQTVYFSSFLAFGDVRGVRMAIDTLGAVTYQTYIVSEDNNGNRNGQFVDASRPAHPSSGHTSDGVITILAAPEDVLLFEPGDTLQGFNAGIITFLGAEGVVGASLNGDTMPDGLARQGVFEFLSAKDCAAPARSAQAGGRSAAPAIKGGALGGAGLGLLVLLALAGGRRKR